MEVNEAMRLTGFVPCEGENNLDECDRCDGIPQQLYWRSVDPFSQDGEYFCGQCVTKEAEANKLDEPFFEGDTHA